MDYSHLRFAIFGNIYQTRKNKYVEIILCKLLNLGVQINIESTFAQFISRQLQIDLSRCNIFSSDVPINTNIAISIGGDGTFLGTAAKIGAKGIPILGINTGRLGFLADVSPDVIEASLDALCRGDYVIEHRTALQVMQGGQLLSSHPYALNEVAVLKHDNSSLIEICTHVDTNYLTTFLADGLIVSTPTGSTGYSLSVGGPILAPNSRTMCISPIAPHSLAIRPVVLRDDVEVTLKVSSRTGSFLLSADGQSLSLPDSTRITLRRAPHSIKVIKITHKHFFDTLRDKLLWGVDQRN